MLIQSKDSLLLDKLYNELEKEHINVSKKSTDVEGAMSATGITTALSIADLTFKTIDTILKLLNFFQKQKNYYIHIKLKDGREMKLNNISEEKQIEEFNAVKDNIHVIYIDKGQN